MTTHLFMPIQGKQQIKNNQCILLVENDVFLGDIYEKNLIMEGFKVIRATNAERGLEILAKKDVDLALVAATLPQMSGFELLAAIKKEKKTAHLPVILLSKLGSEEDVKRAEALAVDGYIIKTHFRPSEIVDKAKKILLQK